MLFVERKSLRVTLQATPHAEALSLGMNAIH